MTSTWKGMTMERILVGLLSIGVDKQGKVTLELSGPDRGSERYFLLFARNTFLEAMRRMGLAEGSERARAAVLRSLGFMVVLEGQFYRYYFNSGNHQFDFGAMANEMSSTFALVAMMSGTSEAERLRHAIISGTVTVIDAPW